MKIRIFTGILLIGIITNCSGDKSPWLWNVDGKKYTLNDFEDAYENYITLMAQQLQMTPDQMKSMIKNPEKSGLPEENMEMLKKLSKYNFPDQYKQMFLLNIDAEKAGFTKKKDIESRLRFIEQFYVAQLYLAEKSKVDDQGISDEEALKAWEQIRSINPQARGIPLDKGLAVTKQRLAMKRAFDKQQEVIKDLFEVYPIQSNPDFKLRDYLKNAAEESEKKQNSAGDTTEKK